MSEMIRGMVVYHRNDSRRGTITAGNQFNGMIAVQWDDGARELLHVSKLMSEKLYNEIKEQERLDKMGLKGNDLPTTTVVYKTSTRTPLEKGKVVGHGEHNLVFVEWQGGSITKIDAKNLLSEIDGIAENQRLLDEEKRLEREFTQVQEECKAKLQEAAKLVREAAQLADSKNVDLQDMHDATDDLEYAMEAAGWRTSSWHC